MKFPSKRYSVIYADPPWSFQTRSDKGEGRSAKKHYGVMSLQEIADLPVYRISAMDSVLMMWATMPMLPEALKVMKAWGFKYKTVGFTWMKQNRRADGLFAYNKDIFTGMGYWTRSNAELCLLGTRGHPQRKLASVRQAILSPIREHSRKPAEAYDRIEQLLDGPYIELFARTRRRGWDAWGNQIEKF